MKIFKLLLIVFLLIFMTNIVSGALNDSVISYWKFENLSYIDEKGSFNGVDVTTTIVPAKIQNGALIDNVNDRINFSKPTYSTNNHTWNFWVNASAWTTARTLLRYGGSNFDGFYVDISSPDLRVIYSRQGPNTDYVTQYPTANLTVNQWHMITGVKKCNSFKIIY